MRLLNARSGEIKEFLAEHTIPPYAIVSHRWEDDEVSFQDWQDAFSSIKSKRRHRKTRRGKRCRKPKFKKGFRKIGYASAQAVKDGIGWIWIDT